MLATELLHVFDSMHCLLDGHLRRRSECPRSQPYAIRETTGDRTDIDDQIINLERVQVHRVTIALVFESPGVVSLIADQRKPDHRNAVVSRLVTVHYFHSAL